MTDIRPVPWLVDEAVTWLEREVSCGSIKSVLEFGSGASTVWLAPRVKTLVSVEHTQEWYSKVVDTIGANQKVDCRLRPRPYNTVCAEELPTRQFDLVIVDGKDRVECAQSSHTLVRPGGWLMLDNSDFNTPWSRPIFDLLNTWKHTTWVQEGPDQVGYIAPNGIEWETTIFRKPL